MKNKIILIIILAVVLVGGYLLFRNRREIGQKFPTIKERFGTKKLITTTMPREITAERETAEKRSAPQEEDKVSQVMLALPKEVKEGLRVAGADDWNDEKQKEWENRLALLRLKADETVPKIAEAIRALPVERHGERYELTFLLGEIGSDTALPVLGELIQEKIPEELMQRPKYEGVPGGNYLIVKTQAVSSVMMIGLESEKKEEVKQTLLDGVGSEHRSVRSASVMAMKQLFPKDAELKEKVTAMLPERDKHFFDLQIQHDPIPLAPPKEPSEQPTPK